MADETGGGIEIPFGIDSSPAITELGKLAQLLAKSMGDAKAYGETIDHVFGDLAAHLKAIQGVARTIGSGGPGAALANAGVQGTGNQLRASELGQKVQLNRQQVELAGQANRLAKEAAGYLALERGELEKTTVLDKARLEVAQALRGVREQIAKGPKDLTLEQSLPLVQRLTEAYANLGRVQREGRESANRDREEAQVRRIAEIENREFDLRKRASDAVTVAKEREFDLTRRIAESENREFDLRKRAADATVAAKERELALDRAAAEQQNRQHTLQQRAAGVVDPQLALQNAAGRTASADRLFGDGGQQLFQIQTRLYAQYTVIRTALSAVQGLVSGVLELDQAFRELQAISGATDTQMTKLQATILAVGEGSRFSLTEIAQAATVMAQAGLSTRQIDTALQGTVQLAAATGSSLKDSVDIVTSALSVFNLRAEETDKVANLVTSALNLSKLTVDKFAQGLQYAGNIAAEAGDDFTTVSSLLAALSNAGIRNGSTLGTGLRELYVGLQKPSAALQERLQLLGVTAEQVDVKANGLVGVLKNLAAAGFTSADAIQDLGTRGAAAFTALVRNMDQVESLGAAFRTAEGAGAAAQVQMEGLEAKLARLKSSAQGVAFVMAGDFDNALGRVVDAGSASLRVLESHRTVVEALGTALASLGTSALLVTAARFTGLAAAASKAREALALVRGGAATAGEGLAFFATGGIGPILGLAAGLTVAVGLLTNGFGLLGDKTNDLAARLEDTKTRMQEAKDRASEYQSAVQAVDGELERVTSRAGRLSTDQGALNDIVQEAKNRFGDLGFTIDGLPKSIDGLISAYERLRSSLQKGVEVQLKEQAQGAVDHAKALVEQVNSKNHDPTSSRVLGAFGFRGPPSADLPDSPATDPADALRGALGGAQVGDPQLADAVKALSEKLSLESPEAVQGALDRLATVLSPLQDRLRSGGLPPEMVKALTDLKDALLERRGLVAQVQADQTQARQADAGASDAGFLRGLGAPVEAALDRSRANLSTLTNQKLSGVTNQEDRLRIAKEVQKQALDQLDEDLKNATSGLGDADQASVKRLLGDKIAAARETIIQGMGDTATAAAKEIEKEDQTRLATVRSTVERLSGKLGGKSTGDDAAVLRHLKSLIDTRAGLEKKVFDAQNYGKVTDDVAAQAHSDIEARAKEDFQKLKDKSADAFARVNEKNLQENVSLLDREASMLEARFTGRNPKGTPADMARLTATWDKIDKLQAERIRAQHLDPDQEARELALIKTGRAQKEEQFADRQGKSTSSPAFDPKFFEEDLSASLNKPFALIQKSAETQAKALAEPLRALQAEIGELDKPGISERVPAFLKDRLGRKAQGLQDDQLQAEGANARNEQLALKAKTDEMRAEFNELSFQAADMERKLTEAAGQPKTPDLERLQSDYTQVTTRVQRLNEAIAQGDQAQEAAAQKADEAAVQLQARAEALAAEHMSVGETVAGAYDAWARSAGVLDGKVKVIGDTATATFGALRDGVAGWVISVANGTQTAGAAFKSFGVSIAQTLEKVAAERFADYLIGAVFGAFLGPRIPGVGTGGNTLAGGNGSLTFGGPRAGGGPITGGTPGRDSVLTPSMPGEWVLRKGAVDMIGRDALEQMNKTGRIPVAKAQSIVPIPVPQGGGGTVNVWSVHPDQVPPPSEQDVIAYVHRDIMTGGTTKRLIHSVALGQM